MTNQTDGNNLQPTNPQSAEKRRTGTCVNNWSNVDTAGGSSNRPQSHIASTSHAVAPRPCDPIRENLNNGYFNSLVDIVRDAPEKCPSICAKVLSIIMDNKKLVVLFERARKHAVIRKLTKLDEVIIFAVADMFGSESKPTSWYGPRLVSRILTVGSHHVRYLILSLVLAAFRARIKLNMSLKSTSHFLAGILVVLKDAEAFMNRLQNKAEEHRMNLDKFDHITSQFMVPRLAAIPTDWFLSHKNPYLALRIYRLISWVDPIRECLNRHEGFQTMASSFLSNPVVPEGVFCELLSFAAKSHGFLGILDKRSPLGTVPQVFMHVAEYCMNKTGPSWSVPRFLTKENVSAETFNKTSEVAFLAVKSFAASIEKDSLYFEPLCDCIMRMCTTEVLTDKGSVIGRAFGTVLSRFPSCVTIRDDFIVKLISGIHSCDDGIAALVDQLLDVIISQYPKLMKKHTEAVIGARRTRKILQCSLNGELNYFPEMPHDWYP